LSFVEASARRLAQKKQGEGERQAGPARDEKGGTPADARPDPRPRNASQR
jgi:hypothetical protein